METEIFCYYYHTYDMMSSPAFCSLLPYYNIHGYRSKLDSQVNIFPLCMYLDVLVSDESLRTEMLASNL